MAKEGDHNTKFFHCQYDIRSEVDSYYIKFKEDHLFRLLLHGMSFDRISNNEEMSFSEKGNLEYDYEYEK